MDREQGSFDWGFGGAGAQQPQQPQQPQQIQPAGQQTPSQWPPVQQPAVQQPAQPPRQLPRRDDPFAEIQRPVKEEIPSWDADLSFDPSDLGFEQVEIPRKSLGRRLAGPIIFLVIFVGLAVFGTIAADNFARDAVSGVIAGAIGDTFKGDEDAVTVDLGEGLFLGQAAAGTINDVSIVIPEATLGALTGAIHLTATGVPTSTSQPTESLSVEFVLPEESALAFAATLSGSKTTSALGDGVVAVTSKVAGKKITVAYAPTAVDGALVLTPQTIAVGDSAMTPDEFTASKYGTAGKSLTKVRTLCVADKLPSALTFDSMVVNATSITITASGTKVPLVGGGITTPGTCEAE